jgi:1-acyl-sn-glycerol-3-phosphate acyltransferase
MLAALKSIARLAGPPLDPDAVSPVDLDLARVVAPILELVSHYFRAEVSGLEKIPEGGALLAANHNAGITSIEPMLLGLRYYKHTHRQDLIRSLGHDLMGKIPLLGNFLIALGMVRASHAAADRALTAGQKVLVLPGGNYEAFRPFGQRHQVDFGGHVGYVRLALRNNVPVVPVLNLGGHETLFVVFRGAALARLTGAKKLLRSDSFPLFFALPWGVALGPMFHLPIPAKLVVEVGEPIDLREQLQGEDPEDPRTLRRLSELVQGRVQQMMDRQAAKRRWPVIG